LPSRRNSDNPKPGCRGLLVWWEVSCLAPSVVYPFRGLVLQLVTGFGHACRRGYTHIFTERGCLSERFRSPQAGQTPLHLASLKGHASVVRQLLAAGAVTDAKCRVRRVGVARCRWGRVEGRHAACCGIFLFWLLLVSAAVYDVRLGFCVW